MTAWFLYTLYVCHCSSDIIDRVIEQIDLISTQDERKKNSNEIEIDQNQATGWTDESNKN